MTHVYFRCSNRNELLVDRCGTVVDDLAEARDHAAVSCDPSPRHGVSKIGAAGSCTLTMISAMSCSSSPFLSCWASRVEGRAVRDRLQEATNHFSKSLSRSGGTRCAVCGGGFGLM